MAVPMIRKIARKFPYRGARDWAMLCSLSFVAAQLLWYCSRFVRRYDVLEIAFAILFFPVAPCFDPYNGMVNSRQVFVYGLIYWVCLYFVALAASRRKVNPALPAAGILVLTCVASVIYSVFFVYHGPVR